MNDERPKPVRRTSRKNLKSNGFKRRDEEENFDQQPVQVSRSKNLKNNSEVHIFSEKIESELNYKKVEKPPVEKRRNNSIKKSVRKNKAQGCYSQLDVKNDDGYFNGRSARSKSEKIQTRKKKPPIDVENDENDRSMLLNQIHQGMKLKSTKHLMVDKSGPKIDNVKQKVSDRSDDSHSSHLEGKSRVLKKDLPKDNKKYSPLDLETELKQKMKIFGENEFFHKEKNHSNNEDSQPPNKHHLEIRPPLPPKPKFSSNLNLKDTMKTDKKFRSLRNLGKQRGFNRNLDIEEPCFKPEKLEINNNVSNDHFEYFNGKIEYRKNSLNCNENNPKVRSNLNISSTKPASAQFQNKRKVISKLFSADSEDFEDLQVNNRVSKSSRSIDKLGKDFSDNRFDRISSASNINENLKHQVKHVTNLDDDETEDEDTETESSSLNSQTVSTQGSNGSNLSKQANDYNHNNTNNNKNIKSKFASAKKFLERFHSSSQESDSFNNNNGLTSPKNNKFSNNQNKENFFENSISNSFLNRFLSNDDSNKNNEKEHLPTNTSKININENRTKINEMNTPKERILIKTRSAGVGKVPLKRPSCPPPLPPNFPPPPPPNQVLSANASLTFKNLEDRFTFHNVSEFPPPPPFHPFASSPTINSGERFYQQSRGNVISHKKSTPDPYETTV